MAARFIVVEGCDGTGKTSTAKRLAASCGYTYVKTPPETYAKVRSFFDDPKRPVLARFHFYCAGLQEAAISIRKMLHNNIDIVADRYALTTQIYHELLTGQDLSREMEQLDLPQPDITFIMQAPLPILLDRIRSREPDTDKYYERNFLFLDKVNQAFTATVGLGIHHVDTSQANLDDITRYCAKRATDSRAYT